jgi:hypothetical protein
MSLLFVTYFYFLNSYFQDSIEFGRVGNMTDQEKTIDPQSQAIIEGIENSKNEKKDENPVDPMMMESSRDNQGGVDKTEEAKSTTEAESREELQKLNGELLQKIEDFEGNQSDYNRQQLAIDAQNMHSSIFDVWGKVINKTSEDILKKVLNGADIKDKAKDFIYNQVSILNTDYLNAMDDDRRQQIGDDVLENLKIVAEGLRGELNSH